MPTLQTWPQDFQHKNLDKLLAVLPCFALQLDQLFALFHSGTLEWCHTLPGCWQWQIVSTKGAWQSELQAMSKSRGWSRPNWAYAILHPTIKHIYYTYCKVLPRIPRFFAATATETQRRFIWLRHLGWKGTGKRCIHLIWFVWRWRIPQIQSGDLHHS